jgi:HEAT repeat protein
MATMHVTHVRRHESPIHDVPGALSYARLPSRPGDQSTGKSASPPPPRACVAPRLDRTGELSLEDTRALSEALWDEREEIRSRSLLKLVLMRPEPELHDRVVQLAQEDSLRNRVSALLVLARTFPDHGQTIVLLRAGLRDADASMCMAACIFLQEPGESKREAVPELVQIANTASASSSLRARAAKTLGHIGVYDHTVSEALFGALKDSDSWVRLWAVRALFDLHIHDARIKTALRRMTLDVDPQVRSAARQACEQLGIRKLTER